MLFPFNGGRWLGADVVGDAIDTADLIDDTVRDFGQELIWQMAPIGGHAVGGSYCSERNRVFIGAFVAHDANGLDRQKDGSCLPNLVV
jgi:hypothetical protein